MDLRGVIYRLQSAERKQRFSTVERLKAQIPVLKETIKQLEANQIDHEAMHAGEVAPV